MCLRMFSFFCFLKSVYLFAGGGALADERVNIF